MATRLVLAELVGVHRSATGEAVDIQSVGGVDAAKRVRAGEPFDFVVLAEDAVSRLETDGFVVPRSPRAFLLSSIALAVPAGSDVEPVLDEDGLKTICNAARRIGISTGPSGGHLTQVFKRWAPDGALVDRLVTAPPGTPVASLVARGEVDLGFQQLSEMIGCPGIDIVQELPASVQTTTTFTVAIAATCTDVSGAERFLDFLTSAAAKSAIIKHGLSAPAPSSD